MTDFTQVTIYRKTFTGYKNVKVSSTPTDNQRSTWANSFLTFKKDYKLPDSEKDLEAEVTLIVKLLDGQAGNTENSNSKKPLWVGLMEKLGTNSQPTPSGINDDQKTFLLQVLNWLCTEDIKKNTISDPGGSSVYFKGFDKTKLTEWLQYKFGQESIPSNVTNQIDKFFDNVTKHRSSSNGMRFIGYKEGNTIGIVLNDTKSRARLSVFFNLLSRKLSVLLADLTSFHFSAASKPTLGSSDNRSHALPAAGTIGVPDNTTNEAPPNANQTHDKEPSSDLLATDANTHPDQNSIATDQKPISNEQDLPVETPQMTLGQLFHEVNEIAKFINTVPKEASDDPKIIKLKVDFDEFQEQLKSVGTVTPEITKLCSQLIANVNKLNGINGLQEKYALLPKTIEKGSSVEDQIRSLQAHIKTIQSAIDKRVQSNHAYILLSIGKYRMLHLDFKSKLIIKDEDKNFIRNFEGAVIENLKIGNVETQNYLDTPTMFADKKEKPLVNVASTISEVKERFLENYDQSTDTDKNRFVRLATYISKKDQLNTELQGLQKQAQLELKSINGEYQQALKEFSSKLSEISLKENIPADELSSLEQELEQIQNKYFPNVPLIPSPPPKLEGLEKLPERRLLLSGGKAATTNPNTANSQSRKLSNEELLEGIKSRQLKPSEPGTKKTNEDYKTQFQKEVEERNRKRATSTENKA